ncbi:MAG: carboxypeptidase regulatory-like domain-containing protein [Candidatus Poribacteria bacterium]|nr:carboxypeptidase regulatory-like domain-containing protein [Candidatus Poribacteria bacterium]MDE0502631.1 carboxypeptidase regulatory-like domain-containing protein [Candidatus Poribacteria bacterium]
MQIDQSGSVFQVWRNSRFSLFVLCLSAVHLVLVSPVIAQDATGSIKGKIIDRQHNNPLMDQKVTLTIHQGTETQQRETTTASDGSYSFDDLSIGVGTYYTVATVHEGREHTETDVVLSTWVPESKVDIDIGAFTDDLSVVKIRQHTIIIAPPPPDHAPDGALTITEFVQFENTSDMEFRTTVNSQAAGMYLNLPIGHEGLQIDSLISKNLAVESNKLISKQPLASGTFASGFSYIMHVVDSGLDLSRSLTFDTDQLYVFITEGLPLTPQSPIFGAGRREEFHNTPYIIYATNPAKPLSIGKTVRLNFKVAPVTAANGSARISANQPADPKMIGLIALAAACASGFLVAAIFMVRSGATKATPSGSTATNPDSSWLNKLGSDDLDSARIARFEMVTRLDEMYKKKEISERVYNRLRKEQVDRLTSVLEKNRKADGQ